MKTITKKWLDYAAADYQVAKVLLNDGKKLGAAYQAAVFHCHQSIEKMLKAVLTEQGRDVVKIHNLVRLMILTEVPFPANIETIVSDLNPHYIPPRYPDLDFAPQFSFTYNLKNTTHLIHQTNLVIIWLEKKISSLSKK